MKLRNLAIATAVAASFAAGPASSKEILTSAWLPPANLVNTAGYGTFAKKVEELTGGEITIRHTAGPALMPPSEHLSGLVDGIVGVAMHSGTYTPVDLPEDNVISFVSMRYSNSLAIAGAYTEFWMTDKVMLERQKKGGFVYGGAVSTPNYSLICSKPRVTLEDLQGAKIRTPGPAFARWAKKIGAVPVSVPSSESFTGLEKGQLDCTALYPAAMQSYSLWDVAKYNTLLPSMGPYFAGWMFAANADTWADLTPKDRRAFFDAYAAGVAAMHMGDRRTEKKVIELAVKEHKVSVVTADQAVLDSAKKFAEEDALQLAVEAAAERFNISEQDAKGIIERFTALYKKWDGLVADIGINDDDKYGALLKREIYDKLDEKTYGVN